MPALRMNSVAIVDTMPGNVPDLLPAFGAVDFSGVIEVLVEGDDGSEIKQAVLTGGAPDLGEHQYPTKCACIGHERARRDAGHANQMLLQMGNLISVGLSIRHRFSRGSFVLFLPMHKQVMMAIKEGDAGKARLVMLNLLTETRIFTDIKDYWARRRWCIRRRPSNRLSKSPMRESSSHLRLNRTSHLLIRLSPSEPIPIDRDDRAMRVPGLVGRRSRPSCAIRNEFGGCSMPIGACH